VLVTANALRLLRWRSPTSWVLGVRPVATSAVDTRICRVHAPAIRRATSPPPVSARRSRTSSGIRPSGY